MNEQQTPSRVTVWLTAVRPFAYTASVLTVLLGLAIAVYAGFPVRWGLLALTLLGVVSFHTAANLLNDCFDHRRGLDTEPFPTSGAVIRGWISEQQALRAGAVLLAVGVASGLVLTWLCGWPVLAIGIVGTAIALSYTLPGFCLKYRALGDLGVFLSFGVLPVLGTFWVQTGTFNALPVLWSVPLCSYTVAILHANNWRDIETDRAAGCRTFAGILGVEGSRRYYRLLVLGPYVLAAALAAGGYLFAPGAGGPLTSLLVVLSAGLAIKLTRVDAGRDAPVFAMLDGRTAQLHLAFGLLLVVGFFLGRVF